MPAWDWSWLDSRYPDPKSTRWHSIGSRVWVERESRRKQVGWSLLAQAEQQESLWKTVLFLSFILRYC